MRIRWIVIHMGHDCWLKWIFRGFGFDLKGRNAKARSEGPGCYA